MEVHTTYSAKTCLLMIKKIHVFKFKNLLQSHFSLRHGTDHQIRVLINLITLKF